MSSDKASQTARNVLDVMIALTLSLRGSSPPSLSLSFSPSLRGSSPPISLSFSPSLRGSMHLGQIDFVESDDGNGSKVAPPLSLPFASAARRRSVSGRRRSSTVSSAECSVSGLKVASEILGVAENELVMALTHRTVRNVKAELDVKMAKSSRDALQKELYGRLFNWIVNEMNCAMGADSASPFSFESTIGILDIFGFEIFQTNSFSQLCINYANEWLQQQFTNHTFDMEEKLYKSERVPWDVIAYASNEDVIDLISGPSSIFSILDEECLVPRGNDLGFLSKCKAAFKNQRKFGEDFKNPTTFHVFHYAGKVTYETESFVQKNKDRMLDDLALLMNASSNAFVSGCLFSEEVADSASSSSSSYNNSNGNGNGNGSKASSALKRRTLSRKFSSQLDELLSILLKTQPHYIRCIKTNSSKSPLVCHGKMVVEQLLYSGVFEATEIRKKGYPFRLSHERFYRKFWMLDKPSSDCPSRVTEWRLACSSLISSLAKRERYSELNGSIVVGETLVLWRINQNHALRVARKEVEALASVILQSNWRCFCAKRTVKVLSSIRNNYVTASKTRDIQLVLELFEMCQAATFRNHYIVKAEKLKRSIEREIELEEQFKIVVPACTLDSVDENFEKLVEDGREVGMTSSLFR